MPNKSDREILLGLCASLTLADHLGDVMNDVCHALKLAGFDPKGVDECDEMSELGALFAKKGIKTLWGTDLTPEEPE